MHSSSASITVEALNALAAVAAHLTDAPTALIAQRDPFRSTIRVCGRYGTLITEVDMSFVLPDLNPDRQPMMVLTDVRRDPRLRNHPLLEAMPHLRSLIAMLVPYCAPESRAVLKVINPAKAALTNGRTMQMLSEICLVAGSLLKLRQESPAMPDEGFYSTAGDHVGFVLQEEGRRYAEPVMAAEFLMDTLLKRRHLHSRNSANYITLRSWRSALKKHQIAALQVVKAVPPAQFVATAADEIALSMRRIFGDGVVRSVIPVPPGSSGGLSTLSIKLARGVADRLNANLHDALITTGPIEIGASSPHKSKRLAPYGLREPVPGPILIVDDVATSGRHIELAMEACRTQTQSVYAVAWIGG